MRVLWPAVTAALCLPCGGSAGQEALKDRTVTTEDAAYVLLPPELACGPSVIEAKWSSDGR